MGISKGGVKMIGRKKLDNIWKEEWELSLPLDIKDINNPIEIKLCNILIEFETKEYNGYTKTGIYKYNNIEYCAYIPYTHEVFNGIDISDEYLNENEELFYKMSLIREDIEEKIERYLEENNYIEEDDEELTPVKEDEMPF